ncbi:hypothetical protein RN001_000963 [Aquatica leii]|uniref:Solute carrier family 46 member 3 n=1 Tax=Aquatica leii TaxID=1421715 RepID=A0AAN7Q7K0_9COLE|nr:hypothetical protein RN001_000963 [Aquatica leii]
MTEKEIEKPNQKQNGILHRLNLCKQYITVEPVLLLFMMPFSMSSLTIQNLNLEKACRVNLNLTESICDALQFRNRSGYNESDEILVQRVVASSYIWKNVVYGVFPAILLPMLGSWSDRNNVRKALMLIPLAGEVIANVGFLLCTYFFYQLSMEVSIAVEVFPTALTGGSNMFLLGIFTYVATISTTKYRTFRIGVVHVLFNISVTIGYALSGIMYNEVGFYGVFSISLIMYSLAAIYTMYYINEIENTSEKVRIKLELIKDMVNVKQTYNTFRFLFKPHPTNRRTHFAVIMVLAILVLGPFIGEMTVMYLYTRFKFNWDEINYSIFYAYYCVAHLFGCLVALSLFTKYLGLDDALLGAISSVSKIIGGVAYMLAKTPVIFYIATLLEIFNGTAFIASRSILTKLVSNEELGKVNSLFGIAEAVTGLIYGPVYSAIYKAFLHSFPSAFFLVGIIFTIPPILMYLWLYKHRHIRESSHQPEDVKTKEPLLVQTNEIITLQNCEIHMDKKK